MAPLFTSSVSTPHETQTQGGHDVHIVIWCDNTTRSARSVSRSVSSIPRAFFKLAQHNSSAAYRLCLSTGGFSRSSDVEVGAIAAGFAGPSGSRIRAAVRDSLTRTWTNLGCRATAASSVRRALRRTSDPCAWTVRCMKIAPRWTLHKMSSSP